MISLPLRRQVPSTISLLSISPTYTLYLPGSGKTAAFVLPVLSAVAARTHRVRRGLQAVLLAPTRELSEQIHREAERLSAGKRLKIGVLKKNVASAALGKQVSLKCLLYLDVWLADDQCFDVG